MVDDTDEVDEGYTPIVSSEERNAIDNLLETMREEFDSELERWKLVSDYVLPHVKYGTKPNEHSRRSGEVENLVHELSQSFCRLCVPQTKEFFTINNYNKETDIFEKNMGLTARLKYELSLMRSDFYIELKRMLTMAFAYGQGMLRVDYHKKKKSLIFKEVPQFTYQVLQRNDEIYGFSRSRRTTYNRFLRKYPTARIAKPEPDQAFISYREVWINTKLLRTNHIFTDTTSDWMMYLIKTNLEQVNFNTAKVLNTSSDYEAISDLNGTIMYKEPKDVFNYVYLMLEKRNDSSYGTSKLLSNLDAISDLEDLTQYSMADIKGMVEPPLIMNTQNVGTFDTSNNRIIVLQDPNADVRSSVHALSTNGRTAELAWMKTKEIVANLRRVFGLDDLEFLSNPNARRTEEQQSIAYMDRLDSVYPILTNVLVSVVAPVLQTALTLLMKHHNDFKQLDKNSVVVTSPPIVKTEALFSKMQTADIVLKKILELSQVDNSILTVVDFDAYIREFIGDDLDHFEGLVRTPEAVAQIRQAQSEAQKRLQDSEIYKNTSQADKNRANAEQIAGLAGAGIDQAQQQVQPAQNGANQQSDVDMEDLNSIL